MDKVATKYDFETFGWETSAHGRAEYQKIFPAYWNQDPLDSRSTIQVFYRHSPTTELLRKQTLRFRLRLPPARNVHTDNCEGDHSFNELFTEKCTTEFADDIQDALDAIGVDDARLGSASALTVKDYPLDSDNLVRSYFEQLDAAIDEFCSTQSDLPVTVNDVFERVYQSVFDEEPAGEFAGGLSKKH